MSRYAGFLRRPAWGPQHTVRQCALRQALEALQRGAVHEALVCCAGYLLGEYGRLVADVPAHVQFALLQERFVAVSSEAKARARDPGAASPVALVVALVQRC